MRGRACDVLLVFCLVRSTGSPIIEPKQCDVVSRGLGPTHTHSDQHQHFSYVFGRALRYRLSRFKMACKLAECLKNAKCIPES
eukprot:4884422-Amphidinium_carterae.1